MNPSETTSGMVVSRAPSAELRHRLSTCPLDVSPAVKIRYKPQKIMP